MSKNTYTQVCGHFLSHENAALKVSLITQHLSNTYLQLLTVSSLSLGTNVKKKETLIFKTKPKWCGKELYLVQPETHNSNKGPEAEGAAGPARG